MTIPAITPAQRLVLRALAHAKQPETLDGLAQILGRSSHSVEHLTRKLRHAIKDTGVQVIVRQNARNRACTFELQGQRATVAALLGESSTSIPPVTIRLDSITLPSIGGLSYAYTSDCRLMVGGELQPVRL